MRLIGKEALLHGAFFVIVACGDSDQRREARDSSVPEDDAEVRADASGADGSANVDSGDSNPSQDAQVDAEAERPDAGQDPMAVGCTGRDYLLCEDFESAAPGSLPAGWSVGFGWMDGDPAVTSDQSHSGTRSLRSASAQAGQRRAERNLEQLGEARGHHWGRVFYKVTTPFFVPAAGSVVHNTLVGLLGSTECRVVDTVVASDGSHQFLFNLPDDSCCVGSSYDYRSYDAAWHCAEWFVDRENQSFRFFLDGAEVEDLAFAYGSDLRAHIEDFTGIALGWRNYQTATTPYESWLDDLAIDTDRIGCD